MWKEEEWINWLNYNINIYEIPNSSNILLNGNSVNVTRVTGVLAEERKYIYILLLRVHNA